MPFDEAITSPAILAAERQLDMLAELAELGMDLARRIHAEAMADLAPVGEGAPTRALQKRDPAESFARVTRAIRLTFALETQTHQAIAGLRAPRPGSAQDWLDDEPNLADAPWMSARRRSLTAHEAHQKNVFDQVARAVSDQVTDYDQAMELLDEVHERLTEYESADTPLYRPLRETVEAICDDLGLKPDWGKWAGDGWAPRTELSHFDWGPFWNPHPGRREARETAKAASPSSG